MVKYKNINLYMICLALLVVASGSALMSCQQAKDLPGQVSDELPNPVKDFTEKDRYLIGLRWFEQGQYDIARKFWKPLSESGDCDAQYAMGLLYYYGLSVGKSQDKSIELWSLSAGQGQAQALQTLGIVYSHSDIPYVLDCKKGCGVERNLVEAYKMFRLAVKYGTPHEDDTSEQHLDLVRSEMNPEELERAEALTAGWKADPAICESRNFYILAD